MRSVRRLHVQKKARQKSLLQKFLGESFLCLRKEKPYRIIKHFSREIKKINKFSRESKSPPKLLKPKPPMVTKATLLARYNCHRGKMFLQFVFPKKQQLKDLKSAVELLLSFTPGTT